MTLVNINEAKTHFSKLRTLKFQEAIKQPQNFIKKYNPEKISLTQELYNLRRGEKE